MADNVEVDPERLRSAAGRTGDVRDNIAAVIRKLTTALDARGEVWGHDSLGRQFSSQYVPSRNSLVEGAGQFETTFDNYATGQVQAADRMEDMDHSNGDGFR